MKDYENILREVMNILQIKKCEKIGAIKRKEKTPLQAGLGSHLNTLKGLNPGQYDDLIKDYKEAVALHEAK